MLICQIILKKVLKNMKIYNIRKMSKDNKLPKKNSNEKINIHEEYLQIYEKHVAKYGEKTIVLMQVGSFHECYSTETRGPNLFQISDLLNIVCTRKDKSISKIDEKNPFMLGFTSVAIQKYLKILIDNQFTVVVIDQVTPAPDPKRAITGIYSPSTFIDNVSIENKYLMTLYFETNSALNSSKSNVSVGMSAVDTSTGQVYWYESHGSGLVNENESWEEAQRFYHHFRPVELIVYQINNILNTNSESNKVNINEKIDLLPNQVVLSYSKINPEFTKISYQSKLLKKVYPSCGMDSPIEYLNLEKYPYATISIVNSFDYIHQHNENLIKELKVPEYFNEHKYMVLGNNAQYQLNIVDYYNWDKIDSKFHSLNSVINNCSTPMGKRMLKQRLCAPFTDTKTIQSYYDLTEQMLSLKLWEQTRSHLKEISDLDKLFRKLSIKFIQPYELYSIYNSMGNIVKIIELLSKSEFKKELYNMFSKSKIKQFISSINQIENKFDIEILKVSNLVEVKKSFYLRGIYPDIDTISDNIENSIGMIENLSKVLEELCPDVSLAVKSNDRDGYYMSTTKIRGEKLQKELAKRKINFKLGTVDINWEELKFVYQVSTCKITYSGLSSHSEVIDDLYVELDKKTKEYFYQDSLGWYSNNSQILKDLINMVVQLDLITNNAFTSIKYHYTKPNLLSDKDSNSFIYSKNLRHPIIERIIDYEYVPHDVHLDNNIKGNLIYGYNGAGKCFDPNTLIMMYNNTLKKASDIKTGDLLMGDDSTPRTVLGTTVGYGEMYEIIPTNTKNNEFNDNFTVNGPHILCLKGAGYKTIQWDNKEERYRIRWFYNGKLYSKSFSVFNYKTKDNAYIESNKFLNELTINEDFIEITVDEYLKKNICWKNNYYLYKKEINYDEKNIEIDPYIIGFWLGDGSNSTTTITTTNIEVVEYFKKYFEIDKSEYNLFVKEQNDNRNIHYSVTTDIKQKSNKNRNLFRNVLNKYNLLGKDCKYIPDDYKYNSRINRLKLLAGIIDSDGYNDGGAFDICLKSKRLMEDVIFIAKSLGFSCSLKECVKTCTNSPTKKSGIYYRTYLIGTNKLYNELPLLLNYKRPFRNTKIRDDPLMMSFVIKSKGIGKYCGFETDKNKKFLLNSFIVTHNSSIMKAIGTTIIMAQCGMYVPADSFEFGIFDSLYTRISGNDNLFKGHSSFIIEMNELRTILNKATPKSLIIGDEICRGTEYLSANAIVASAILKLVDLGAKFLFATHLHELAEMEQIKSLNTIKFFHLSVEKHGDDLIFNRKMIDGTGEQIYGITVAQYIIDDKNFINKAIELKNSLLEKSGTNTKLVSDKKSLYNKEIYMDACTICGSQDKLESHHINMQKDFVSDINGQINIKKKHILKDSKANLIVLCSKCHDNLHSGNFTISGLVKSTNGIKVV